MRTAAALLAVLTLVPSGQSRPLPDETARLAVAGQVWGFLKYHHPGIVITGIHWDSVLVQAVPRVRAATGAAAFAAELHALIDAAGELPACSGCALEDPHAFRSNLDDRLLSDGTLDAAVRDRLRQVLANRRGGRRYVSFPPPGTANFAGDTAYSAPLLPELPQRLLALFRYWNAILYYFPYLYVNDGDWHDVLPEFIPRMIAATTAEDYHLAVLELTTRVRDTHVTTTSPVLTRILGAFSPAFEARGIDGHLVVWRLLPDAPTDGSGVAVGDVITHVDGTPVSELRARRSRYVAAGNPATFERNLIRLVLRGQSDSASYGVLRRDAPLSVRMPMAAPPQAGAGRPTFPVTELVRVLPGGIGVVNMGDIEPAQVDSALALLRDTRGLVMDVRNYPRNTMYRFAAFLNPEATPFVQFTLPDDSRPGLYRWVGPYMAGPETPDPEHYRGRVAILIDERTQSHAEFTAMALRTAPQNRVFGSQTAGADGNITWITLPGGIRTIFTGLGVYYPDGTQTQRIGIVPDVEVRPTLEGVLAGRDEVLERALEWVRGPSAGTQGMTSRPADEADVGTLDGILNAFYEIVSGPAGQPRDWARDSTLYVANAHFTTLNERQGRWTARQITHAEYARTTGPALEADGFFEREIHRTVRRWGPMVHVFSTYEWRLQEGGPPGGRGINSIELFHDGSRWWIVSAMWADETESNPIPPEFGGAGR